MNAFRVELRLSHRYLQAFRDSLGGAIPIPEKYFRAIYDTPEEADAMHALHVSRCESADDEPECDQ